MTGGWPSTLAEHDSMARGYLLSHGIPATEMGEPYHFSGYSSGASMADPQNVKTVGTGFSTSFPRVVNGIHVLDSHASTRLNAGGVPVSLSVSWPAVPPATMARAQALTAVLSQGWSPPPAVTQARPVVGTEVVIRHAMFRDGGTQWAAVLRTEMMSLTMHTYVDSDEHGNRIIVEDTSGARPSTK